MFLAFAVLLTAALPAWAATISLPQTGQTTSYATGDDGDLEKGVAWPSPRFTNNGNSAALEWVSTGLDTVYNSVFNGYWQTPASIKKGRAYFINGGSGTLPELAGYSDESE